MYKAKEEGKYGFVFFFLMSYLYLFLTLFGLGFFGVPGPGERGGAKALM